jgi:hypothetical protein
MQLASYTIEQLLLTRLLPEMLVMKCALLLVSMSLLLACPWAVAAEPLRTLESHCPFTPPATREAWDRRAAELREQLLVTQGLWPMPRLDPVKPRIHGRIRLDGYTIDKVVFESLPGLFVTGNLYRPDPLPAGSRMPAVLCPHGHWDNARFHDLPPEKIALQLATGAERFASAARNPMQARCVQLARMGCVVFHWDMLGYCDSTQISFERAHRFAKQERVTELTDAGWLLFSPLAESHVQSVMGLQTLAVLRSIDFVVSLPEVDPLRIGITGASGGGTQSFIGAAIDPRITVAFPAVMVSTGMQGGCTCENACGTRVGTGNVELASLIAPRPLGLTAANDWTKTMPEDGFPQLQQLFGLFSKRDNVALFPALQFGHNFNHVARTSMYGWMNRHFGLGLAEPVLERDFQWLGRDDLTVWEAGQVRPEGGEACERRLLKNFRHTIEDQLTALLAADGQAEYVQTMRTGWKVVLGLTTGGIEPAIATATGVDAWQLVSPSDGTWSVKTIADQLKEVAQGSLSIVATPKAGGQRRRYAVALSGHAWDDAGGIATLGEQPLVDNPRLAAAYTYCYNLPLVARRARQLAATLAWLHDAAPDDTLTVAGSGAGAGLAAAGVYCLTKTAPPWSGAVCLQLEPAGFRFGRAESIRDPAFLPGSARFLDLPGLVSCLPLATTVRGTDTDAFARYRDVIEGQGGSLVLDGPAAAGGSSAKP